MDRLEPVDAAQRIVEESFPTAIAAFLAGSVLTSQRTETSDLDIVVVLPGAPAPFRNTLRMYGWVVELFVQTPTSLEHYWTSEAASWRSTLLRMCVDSHILTSFGSTALDIQTEARMRLVKGPPPVPVETLMHRRYLLTDLLDDLRGATAQAELAFIASTLLIAASELFLLAQSHWLGAGKWLSRYFADLDAPLLERLVNGQLAVLVQSDRGPLIRAVVEVLDLAGGPLTEGYRVDGEDPAKKNEP
ncbi:MAG TPA: nucleotidyltransferase domain-containing protein [Candidatus Nanopelagicaceae bacterium]|nr:nucleotidyltransferase domain-containing protein [Candidatus Nanopelagicaceae bacterium]